MQATTYQTYWHLKLPSAMGYFFTGLKVALSYALISAVVAEWLGGYNGLGVYMTRVRKSYELDNMFAVIFLISVLTLFLIAMVKWFEKKYWRIVTYLNICYLGFFKFKFLNKILIYF